MAVEKGSNSICHLSEGLAQDVGRCRVEARVPLLEKDPGAGATAHEASGGSFRLLKSHDLQLNACGLTA